MLLKAHHIIKEKWRGLKQQKKKLNNINQKLNSIKKMKGYGIRQEKR